MRTLRTLPALLPLLVSACAVGPDYRLPELHFPDFFKEAPKPEAQATPAPEPATPAITPLLQPAAPDAPPLARKLEKATPQDNAIRSNWWAVFNDSTLNGLEQQAAASSQTIKAAEASFRQARALVAEARAGFFPTVGVNSAESRVGTGTGSQSAAGTSFGSKGLRNNYSLTGEASWVPDFWGKVRRELEANKATAQGAAASLASAVLTVQGELAIDYIDLRIADEQKHVLERAVDAYTKSFAVTENQYKAGIVVSSDMLQAKVQLENAQAQLVDVGVQRAAFEHAIAVLVGKAPADFSIAETSDVPTLPEIPAGVPADLLQRRPDIASAERSVAAANAQIGVAEAAYFPNITLSADGGYQSSSYAQWFTLPSRFWSIGPTLVETLFDAGLRSAQTEAAIAAYDQTVANYRQTVLSSFQEVEDNLAALRIYAQEATVVDGEVNDADKTVEVLINQYKAGTVNYLSVATAQTAALNAHLSAISVRKSRLVASATLIEALGGGWNRAELEKPSVTQGETTPFSLLPPSMHHDDGK